MFTDEHRFQVPAEMPDGRFPRMEVCRKWGVGATYAHKLQARALEKLRTGIGKPAARGTAGGGAAQADKGLGPVGGGPGPGRKAGKPKLFSRNDATRKRTEDGRCGIRI